jgi:hypothetical protein
MYIINYKKAIDGLKSGSINAKEAQKHFIGYCILWGIGIIGLIASAGAGIIGFIIEGIVLAISFGVNKNSQGVSRDLLARFCTIGFPAYFNLILFWGVPCIVGGVVIGMIATTIFGQVQFGTVVGVILGMIPCLIGQIIIIVGRIQGIASVAKANPDPINMFPSETTSATAAPTTPSVQTTREVPTHVIGSPIIENTKLNGEGLIERISDLGDLKAGGIVDDREFRQKKAKIINEFLINGKTNGTPEKFLLSLANLRTRELISEEELALLKQRVMG